MRSGKMCMICPGCKNVIELTLDDLKAVGSLPNCVDCGNQMRPLSAWKRQKQKEEDFTLAADGDDTVQMKSACVVCGETKPKGWEQFRGGWAGHWTECPGCGHIAKYLNLLHYDPSTRTTTSRGAPEWVYRFYDYQERHRSKYRKEN